MEIRVNCNNQGKKKFVLDIYVLCKIPDHSSLRKIPHVRYSKKIKLRIAPVTSEVSCEGYFHVVLKEEKRRESLDRTSLRVNEHYQVILPRKLSRESNTLLENKIYKNDFRCTQKFLTTKEEDPVYI